MNATRARQSRCNGPVFVCIAIFLSAGALRAQLPPVPVPPENPITPEKAVLGKMLFWEEQMSSDNSTACGTCHIPSAGGGDPRANTARNVHPGPDLVFGTADDIRGSRGVVRTRSDGRFRAEPIFFPNPQVTARKAPSFIGAAWAPELFFDGRASATFIDPVTQQVAATQSAALESQAVGPIVSDVEMACELRAPNDVAAKIAASVPMRLAQQLPLDIAAALATYPTYPDLFQAAFGDPAVSPQRIAFAIATYERTLVPDQTPFDLNTMTSKQANGFQVFQTTAGCSFCHQAPLFTDHTYANIGVRPDSEDLGRFNVTALSADTAAFRVPSLRNVGLRAPYFHNGGKQTLSDVIELYRLGGEFQGPFTDVRMFQLFLSPAEKVDLIDFLQNSLTDPRVAAETYPFDRPLLLSERNPYPVSLYGTGTPGSGGIAPELVAPHPSYLGNDRFAFGVTYALGGATAVLGFSSAMAPPGSYIGSNPLWIAAAPALTLIALPTYGAPGAGGSGTASLVLPIPADPFLDRQAIFAQAFVIDPLGPGGLAVTNGAAITLYGL